MKIQSTQAKLQRSVEHKPERKGGSETVTFHDAAELTVHVSTTGVDGGDGSKHEIDLKFVTGTSEPVSIHLTACGDGEARVLQQAFQYMSEFFLKHGFHRSI